MNPQHWPAVRSQHVSVARGLGLLQLTQGEVGARHWNVRDDGTGQLQEGPVLVAALVVLTGRV
jgi:hypothetical protein